MNFSILAILVLCLIATLTEAQFRWVVVKMIISSDNVKIFAYLNWTV